MGMESVRAVSTPPSPSAADPERLDEAALWPLAARGDRRAAERLVEKTYSDIYGALVKLCGDRDLASDLTQETYRKAWAAIGRFNGQSRFSTWVYRIAYNTFLNHLRRPARLVPLEAGPASVLADPSRSPQERLDRSQESERLRRAVIHLPEQLRFVVTARFWAELPVREIARLQGLSTVGARKRLKRALQQLAMTLEEELT